MGGIVVKSIDNKSDKDPESKNSKIDPNFLENYLEKQSAANFFTLPKKTNQTQLSFPIKFDFINKSRTADLNVNALHQEYSEKTESDRNLLHTDIKILKEEFDSLVLSLSWIEALRVFFNETFFSISIYNIDQANVSYPPIIFINKSFTKMTGYTEKDIIGKNHQLSLFKHTEEELKKKFLLSLKERKPSKIPLTNQTRYGQKFYNLIIMRPVYDSLDNKNDLMVCIHCDIMNPQCNMRVLTYAEKLSRIISFILAK